MTLITWLQQAEQKLNEQSVPSARLDALVLLEDALGKDRSWILANPDFELTTGVIDQLGPLLERRSSHEPLAYIRGHSEFYGRTFLVTPATLQPRPETETMIEQLLVLVKTGKLAAGDGLRITDIGTGSGAIAITAKLELPDAVVYGTEIQDGALAVARRNATALAAAVELVRGNLLEPLKNTGIDIILANLPYVPASHTINQAAMQEPAIAIFGGEDGLDLYRTLFTQLSTLTQKPQYVLAESLPTQHESLAAIAGKHGYALETTDDFIQVFRRLAV